MPRMRTKLLCWLEIDRAANEQAARAKLDAFREAALPAENYGVTITEFADCEHFETPQGIYYRAAGRQGDDPAEDRSGVRYFDAEGIAVIYHPYGLLRELKPFHRAQRAPIERRNTMSWCLTCCDWFEPLQGKTQAFNDRETATILHALRIVQCGGRIQGCAAGDCEHFEDAEALTDTEIDALCERINFGATRPGNRP